MELLKHTILSRLLQFTFVTLKQSLVLLLQGGIGLQTGLMLVLWCLFGFEKSFKKENPLVLENSRAQGHRPTRYCPNLTPHAHFNCTETGQIFDVQIDQETLSKMHALIPKGFLAENIDLCFSGKGDSSTQ